MNDVYGYTYDANGNPLTFDGYTYTWEAGRQLANISKNNLNVNYKYNNGIRTSKNINGNKTNYSWVDNKITSETTGDSTIHYRYNADDELVGLFYDGQEYFYVRNLQNDIISIINSGGTTCVTYTYDAWGNVTVNGAMGSTLGVDNPFRYRGYYYDKETGLYYLQSRYYNPAIGRFINADDALVQLGDYNNTLQYNLFTYCVNNPVMQKDPFGFNSIAQNANWLVAALFSSIAALKLSGAALAAKVSGMILAIAPYLFWIVVAVAALVITYYIATSVSISRADTKIRNRVRERPNLYFAVNMSRVMGQNVLSIGGQLTQASAVARLRSGGNVITMYNYNARKVAALAGASVPMWHARHQNKPGHFPHYHVGKHVNSAHCFYLL